MANADRVETTEHLSNVVPGPRPLGIGAVEEEVARRIIGSVASLKYGSVEVTVHDGRVVQIDRRERVRIDPNGRR